MTFPGGAPKQLTAQQFFKKKGFKQIGKDPDYLYYPLKKVLSTNPRRKKRLSILLKKRIKVKF